MKHLYYIRHGQTVMNTQGIYSGHTDTPLTEEGRRQAKLAGQAAKEMEIDLIICSPLSRAVETAQIIAQEIGYPLDKIELNPDLIERNFGAMEATPWSPNKSKSISQLGITVDVDGIEQIDELIARAKKVVDHAHKHPSESEHILLVGHGGIGRAIRHHIKPDHDFHDHIPNAELVRWI